MAIQFFQTANFANSVTATSFVKSGGTSSQYLMADGSTSTGSSSVAWADITSKPTTISGFGITDAFSGSYADLTNVPSTFAPSAHNHDGTYLKLSGGTMTGDITMSGISPSKIKSNGDLVLQVDADNNTSGSAFKLLGGGGSTLFKIVENGNIDAHGVINFTGNATTTSADRGLYWTGFDKEQTTDFSDNASITHTTNTGGHSGSVLEIKSMNDSSDGIAFTTHASSLLKHNNNAIFSEGHKPTWSEIESKPSTFAPSSHNHAASEITSGTLATARLPEFIEEKYIFTSNDSNAVYMPMVKGGMYGTSSSSITGQILIKMPSYKSNMMMQFYVDIYEYDTGESLTFRISGYNNNDSNATWYNCSVVNLSDDTDRDFTVRFGADTSNSFQYVTIGETNSVWSYPQVNVRDFYGGYNTLEFEAQGSFNVSFVGTTPGSVSRTHTGNLVATNWNNIANKPSSFTPSSHNQAWSTITSTPTTLAGYGITDAFSGSYNDLSNKPSIPSNYLRDDVFDGGVGLYLQGGSFNAGTDTATAPLVIDEEDFIYTKDGGYLRKLIGKTSDEIQIGQGGTSLISSINFLPGTAGNTAVKVNGNSIFHTGHKPTWSEIDSKPSTFAPSSHNHAASNITSGTFAAARIAHNSFDIGDTTAETGRSVHETGIYTFNRNNGNLGTGTDAAYYSVLAFGQGAGGSVQIAGEWTSGGNKLYWRSLRDTTNNWWDWKEIYHTTHKPTPSEIGAASSSHNHDSTYVNVTGDTMTGQLTATKLRTNHNGSQAAPRYDTSFYVAQSMHYYGHNGTQGMYLGESGNDVYIRGQVAIGGTAIQSGYALTMTGHIDLNNSEINYVNQLHFNDGVRFYDDGNDSYLNFKWNDHGAGGIKFRDGQGHINGYVYGNGVSDFGLLDGDGTWAVRVSNNSAVDLRVNNSTRLACDTGGVNFQNGGTVVGEVTTSGVARFSSDVVAYYGFSDQRLKTDIKATTNNLDKILKLEPVEYTWKDGGREGKKEIGLIAQDVEKVVPEVVRENERLNDDTLYKQVDYEHLVSTLIGAIQEQQDQIAELKSEVTNLKSTTCKCKNQ